MYKLYVEIDSIWKLVDIGSNKPAMSYQCNNIAELKDRQSDYSQSLKLPFTSNNCLIFGYSNEFAVVTDLPYKKINCRLINDNSVLAGPGSYMVIDKITEFFEVQILSGNADFFETLQKKQMSELNLGFYQFGTRTILESYSTAEFCIPKAIFEKKGTSLNNESEHAYPFVWLKNTIEQIVIQNGYTLQTNLTNDQWNKKAINICELKQNVESLINFNCQAQASQLVPVSAHTYTPIEFTIINTGIGSIVKDTDVAKSLLYTAPSDCMITIRFNCIMPNGKVYLTNLEGTIWNDTILEESTREITLTLLKGEGFRFSLECDPLPIAATVTANLEVDDTISTNLDVNIPIGGNLYLSKNLGFETQSDLFKAFVQLYGLTVHVDNNLKVVYAYTMQKLYDNKPNAKNWSLKLHDVSKDNSFVIPGYAQINNIKFSDNSDDNISDSGSFSVNNQTLDNLKSLFTVNFQSGLDLRIGSIGVATIALEEKDSDGVLTFKGGKPHIVDVSVDNYATHSKVQFFIDTFYTGLITMLDNAKATDDEFNLTDQDIEQYRSVKDGVPGVFIPVYIEKFGAFFYVNKIKNFVSGELTKCELVRL